MKWIKDVIVDIVVTILIILAVTLEIKLIQFLVLSYTPLILLIKGLVLFGDRFLQFMKRISTKPPSWFTHILYAINLTVLLISGWWITGANWALIWLLSWLTHRKISPKRIKKRKTNKKKTKKSKKSK